MILVKGYGQMCNNWLQYAHAYAFGQEYGVKTLSMRFAYKYRYFNLCRSPRHRTYTYLLSRIGFLLRIIPYLDIDDPQFLNAQNIERAKKDSLVMIGGWQFRFPELFKKHHRAIAEQFAFLERSIAKEKRRMEQLPEADILLGIHIRRGDYIRWMGGKFFFSDEVFIHQIQQFQRLFPEKKVQVIICTNDKGVNPQKFQKECNNKEIYLNNGSEIDDLYALSRCQYIIGPKSTYSLVAAFYNNAKIHWIKSKDEVISLKDFYEFYDLFMTV